MLLHRPDQSKSKRSTATAAPRQQATAGPVPGVGLDIVAEVRLGGIRHRGRRLEVPHRADPAVQLLRLQLLDRLMKKAGTDAAHNTQLRNTSDANITNSGV